MRPRPIPARSKVIEYTGERISRRETKRRGFGLETYSSRLDDYWTIDGSVGGSGAEYINHSCQPNLRARICKNHILYMSKRAIAVEKNSRWTITFRKRLNTSPAAAAPPAAGAPSISPRRLSVFNKNSHNYLPISFLTLPNKIKI